MMYKNLVFILVNILLTINSCRSNLIRLLKVQAPTPNICSWTCATNCIKCDGIQYLEDGNIKVTLNFASCKNDKISWACCAQTPGCSLSTCDGSKEGTNKCNDLTIATFIVPASTTSMNVQVHDGKLGGNVDCSKNPCCGGSGTSCEGVTSGVCNYIVDLSTCPCTECIKDTDCGLTNPLTCTKPICGIDKKCTTGPADVNTVCKTAGGPCENNAVCDGFNKNCPATTFKSSETICRPAVSVCDIPESCSGTSADCGVDVYQPDGTICERIHGLCGPSKKCSGSTCI